MRFTRKLSAEIKEAAIRWWQSRRNRKLWLGLPAAAAGLGFLLIAFAANTQSTAKLMVKYLGKASSAAAREDFESASVYFYKLIQLGDRRPDTYLAAAHVAHRRGRITETESLLAQLTEGDAPYPAAHLWMAIAILERPGETRVEAAEYHLVRALELNPANAQAHLLLGQLLLEQKSWLRAAVHLEQAVAAYPGTEVPLATSYREQGQVKLATELAEKAAQFFERELTATRNEKADDSHTWALRLSEIQLFLGDRKGAEKTLRDEEPMFGSNRAEYLEFMREAGRFLDSNGKQDTGTSPESGN